MLTQNINLDSSNNSYPIGGQCQGTRVSSKFQRSMNPANANARVNHSVPKILPLMPCQDTKFNIFLKLQTPTGSISRSIIVNEENPIQVLQQETAKALSNCTSDFDYVEERINQNIKIPYSRNDSK